MIRLYKDMSELDYKLSNLRDNGDIFDYRIYLKAGDTIVAYIKASEISITQLSSLETDKIEIEVFTEELDEFLESTYFGSTKTINTFDSDRKLVSLLDTAEVPLIKESINVPIVTFYSYKGGVGRSTGLAAFASHLAIHQAKRVVVIDCDFEAPGFTNFFLRDPGIPFYHNGVIEYLLDKEYAGSEITIRNYLWEVSKDFSGKGEIFVMPSGNLNDQLSEEEAINHREHYLAGLARLDFSERPRIINRFIGLISELQSELKPDIILFDSRTGFNDIFGLTAFHLSKLVVGFFGTSVQTLPGLHFFIDSLIRRQDITGVLANSIIPVVGKRRWFAHFKNVVETYISEKSNDSIYSSGINSDEISLGMFPIARQEILEAIGTKDGDSLDLADLIENRSFGDYTDLFESLCSLLDDHKDVSNPSSSNDVEFFYQDDVHDGLKVESSSSLSESFEVMTEDSDEELPKTENNQIFEAKMRILNELKNRMPELYAEDIDDFNAEYLNGRYFYRTCMQDIFNLDKFIVLGNKGTGKTYIYRSLRNNNIVKELQRRANKTEIDFTFVQLVVKGKYFIDTTKFDGLNIPSTQKYFERFWQIYIWNVIILELGSSIDFVSNLEHFNIDDSIQSYQIFDEIIRDDNKMIIIERDLNLIDQALKEKGGRHCIIVFDELDHIVKPHLWSDRVAPLINLCKRFTYSRIFPKLFLRSDLFEKITNVNNIQALNNRSINIEWTQEELFAYFFKLILANSSDDFYFLMKEYNSYPSQYVNKVRKQIETLDKQPPTVEYTLKHLTSTFFGKYADVGHTPRFGESYDWFYKNLKNANNTISLRPFIDLLSESVRWATREDKTLQPILSQYYYTHGQTRGIAVQRHFNDLASEQGNGDLNYVLQYIRDDAAPKFKVLELPQREFYELLDLIIAKYEPRLDNVNKESLVELLKVNGIIADAFSRTGARNFVQKRYRFALLYKYYLGLRNAK